MFISLERKRYKKPPLAATRDGSTYIRRYTHIQQIYCIIFGNSLQENEGSLAVIFIPKKEDDSMARRKKHPKLPNGYGQIKYLGKNRRNPYAVFPPVTEFDENGRAIMSKALCYVDNWYVGFTVLTWHRNGEYYPGREKELASENNALLEDQVLAILSKFNQTKKSLADTKTYKDIYEEYYLDKFKKPYDHTGEKVSMEYSMRAAFKNTAVLHDKSFRFLTHKDLQKVLNECTLKHASLELILTLYHQMYAYAEANDLCDKDYSKFVKIEADDDDENGVPFSNDELKILWNNKDNEIVEFILIMCYSGYRISAYKDLAVNLKDKYFFGGIKTTAGKNRYVPIHSGIFDLVERRIKHDKTILKCSVEAFRQDMYKVLDALGIPKHTPHDCRHTFSKLCEDAEVKENDRKRMLGHSFSDITNKVYGHRDLEDLRTEIEKIKICY